jgi:hypothetical protein
MWEIENVSMDVGNQTHPETLSLYATTQCLCGTPASISMDPFSLGNRFVTLFVFRIVSVFQKVSQHFMLFCEFFE